MKRPKIINEKIQQQVMKKTVDGIIDVLLRMYEKDESGMAFENFCIDIMINKSYEDFYKMPIAPKPKDN